MIHEQDNRRPLGLPRQMPAQRITTVLELASTAPALGAAPRVAGLKLTATDVDWSSGEGPEVRGRAEPLLVAIAGRRGVTPALGGGRGVRVGWPAWSQAVIAALSRSLDSQRMVGRPTGRRRTAIAP